MWRKIRAFFTTRARLARLAEEIEAIKGRRMADPGVRYAEIQTYSESDPAYVETLVRIASDPAFRFFLYNYREALVEKIEACKAGEAAMRDEACAELKAIGRLREYMERKVAAYYEARKRMKELAA